MDSDDPGKMYDAYYYAHGCGVPYQRDEKWLHFFGTIADRIVSDIQPATVLDAGCAMGFLVEALRQRGVEAYGVDISEYAIQNVHEDIRPYCWQGSITDPFPQKYDLIVSIEVLEHMPRAEAEKAAANFCQHSEDVLFSSTPFDYRETTHFNVQPPEYWAELFARHGFFREVDFDASFITPWAVRFRRKSEPLARMVREYERKFFLLWKENADLRSLTVEMRDQLTSETQKFQEKDQTIQALRAQVQEWELRWIDLEQGFGWRALKKFRELRLRLAPPGSRRDRLFRLFLRTGQVWRSEGTAAVLRAAGRRVSPQEREQPPAPAVQTMETPDSTPETPADAPSSKGKENPADPDPYHVWIAENEPGPEALTAQRKVAHIFQYRPLVSILIVLKDTAQEDIGKSIDSLINQTYDHWEICVAGTVTQFPWSPDDPRIRYQHLQEAPDPAALGNAALTMAQGEWILWLHPGDLLAPEGLYQVVDFLNRESQATLIYFDEDHYTPGSETRQTPFFKPDWSPELLLSKNYLDCAVVRRSLVVKVEGCDPQAGSACIEDLYLRCAERAGQIAHIPKILVHKPDHDLAAAFQAPDDWQKSLERHLERRGIANARVVSPEPSLLRAVWPAKGTKVSIIIPTRNNVEMLDKCLNRIFKFTEYPDFEVILVDNGSNESTFQYYDGLKKDLAAPQSLQIVSYPAPFNYSQANNLGARHATGEILLFLNNDIEALNPDWLEEMVRWAERPEIGAVGAKLLTPENTIQHAGVIMGMGAYAGHVFLGAASGANGPFGSVNWYRDYMAVTAACMMMRREVYEEVGGFDENYALALSDVEICLRIRAKDYRIVYTPFARLLHYEGSTRSGYIPPEDLALGYLHVRDYVKAGDGYYNPNLSYAGPLPTFLRKDEIARYDRFERFYHFYAASGIPPS